MPTYVKGNLWDEIGKVDLLLFTANSTLNTHGQLIMGKGTALVMKQRFPDLPHLLGLCLQERQSVGKVYGICGVVKRFDDLTSSNDVYGAYQWIGAFQTKRHWSQDADPLIIAYSVGMLCGMIAGKPERYRSIAMPFPGIGYGHLQREQILPILEPLPDRVKIYEPL